MRIREPQAGAGLGGTLSLLSAAALPAPFQLTFQRPAAPPPDSADHHPAGVSPPLEK